MSHIKYYYTIFLFFVLTNLSAQDIIFLDNPRQFKKFDTKSYKINKICDTTHLNINSVVCTADSTFIDSKFQVYDLDKCKFKQQIQDDQVYFIAWLNDKIYYIKRPTGDAQYLYKSDLKTKSETLIDSIFPPLITNSIFVHEHELYFTTYLDEVYKMDTLVYKNSKKIGSFPKPFKSYIKSSSTLVENCDSSRLYFYNYGLKGMYSFDFENNKITKVCDIIDTTFYSFETPTPTLNRLSCIDLDRNNSTTVMPKDYKTVMCGKESVVCDNDIKLKTRPGFADSLRVWLTDDLDGAAEKIMLTGTLPIGMKLKSTPKSMTFYFPAVTGEAKIEQLIKQIRYENTSNKATYGTRKVHFYLYASRLVSDPAIAHIEIRKPDSTSTTQQTCAGQNVVIQGISYSKDTILSWILPNSFGCDSLYKLTLTFKAKLQGNYNKTICDNTSYLFDNQTLTKSGVYTKTQKTSSGCDSTITLNLMVLPKKSSTFQQTICDGSSYSFDNQTLTKSGVYTKNQKTSSGCDSSITLNLMVLPLPKITTENVVKMKQGDTQLLTINVQSKETYSIDWQPNKYLNKNDATIVSCVATENIKYKIVVSTANNCRTETMISIEVEKGNHVYIPTAFSPNNDGINDTWQVFSDVPNLEIVSVRVYNRWGALEHDSTAPWLALDASSDVYTYVVVLKINSKTEIYKGDVMVLR